MFWSYVLTDALFAGIAYVLLRLVSDSFKGVSEDPLLAAVAAGFGAMVIMRTRLAVVKGSAGEDYSIGLDLVLSVILRMVDTNVDRDRALERQRIVT